MTSENPYEKAVIAAEKERRELQEQIRASLLRLQELEAFFKQFNRLLTKATPSSIGNDEESGTSSVLGRAGPGLSQTLFEQLLRQILRERGEPLQAQEILDEFDKRGYPVGESKSVSNRLWKAKLAGVVVNFPRPGFWLVDEPVPESASARSRAETEAALSDAEIIARRNKGKDKLPGRKPKLNEEKIKIGEKWIAEGMQKKAICLALGISSASFENYFSKFRNEVKEKRRLAEIERESGAEK